MSDNEDTKERIRLIELDLTQTNDFIKGVTTTGAALRTSAVTVWLAIVGFAIQQALWTLALLGALVPGFFWFVDAYHGWLYDQASQHLLKIERLLFEYYNSLSRQRDDPEAIIRFRAKLRSHKFGLIRSLPKLSRLRDLKSARPRVVYTRLYPALSIVAGIVAVLVGLGVIAKPQVSAPTIAPTTGQTASISNSPEEPHQSPSVPTEPSAIPTISKQPLPSTQSNLPPTSK